MTNLSYLALSSNELSGALPQEIKNLTNLQSYSSLDNNKLIANSSFDAWLDKYLGGGARFRELQRNMLQTPSLTTTPTTTAVNSVDVEVNGDIGTRIFVNGVNTTKVISSSGKMFISLDTSGADGNKAFTITLKDSHEYESDTLSFTIIKDAAPIAPTLTTTPTTTGLNSLDIEINGEVGSKVFVNNVDTLKVIPASGKITITLDTSGTDGYKTFKITLKDSSKQSSIPLDFYISKVAPIVLEPQAIPDTELIGASKGTYNVAQGNFKYNLNIQTPKGINNLSPSLNVQYNSANQHHGTLGVGFKLHGFSSIRLCNESTKTLREEVRRDYNYCLNGEKLYQTNLSQTYGANETTYSTQINSYKKIVSYGSGDKPTHFKVFFKDGSIHEYGNTQDSSFKNNNNKTIIFKRNKKTDNFGNDINYIYDNNHISQINYANNTIDFVYEDKQINKISY